MKYYTTREAAELLGVTKRYVTKLCVSKVISGAEKRGSRWLIPESFIAEKNHWEIPRRVFNTTGTCNPTEHYMVDLTERLFEVRKLVDGGKYFTINRARQFGKTTMLHALAEYLSQDYLGKQYIIEMKIWHGNEYNTRGEEQLLGDLQDYHLERGYMLSFNFNKNKTPGVKEIHFKDHTLVEAVV